MKYKTGETFTGKFKNGERVEGKLTMPDGSYYDGQF